MNQGFFATQALFRQLGCGSTKYSGKYSLKARTVSVNVFFLDSFK